MKEFADDKLNATRTMAVIFLRYGNNVGWKNTSVTQFVAYTP